MNYNKRLEALITIAVFIIVSFYDVKYLIFILFIGLHEIAHLLCGLGLGYKLSQLHIMPLGFKLSFQKDIIRPFDDMIISISGPLINFVFFGLFFVLNKFGYAFADTLANINLIICFFNLIPASFLDGGRVLRTLLSVYTSFYSGYLITSLSGTFLGILMFTSTIFSNLSINSFMIMALGVFLIYKSYLGYKDKSIGIIRYALYKQSYLNEKSSVVIESFGFSKDTKLVDIIKKFCFNKYYVVYLIDSGKMYRIADEADIIKTYCTYGNITIKECLQYLNT